VIGSLLCTLARKLVSVPAVIPPRDSSEHAELLVLRHDNAVPRHQISGPVRYEPADRRWFSALPSLIPRPRWCTIFPITPATLLASHRRLIAAKWDYNALYRDSVGFCRFTLLVSPEPPGPR
jgi:hypothetical protein